MAVIKLPTFREMLWPTYQALRSLNTASMQEIVEKAIEFAGLTEEQTSLPQNNGRGSKIDLCIRFCIYGLRIYGFAEKNQDVWSIKSGFENLQAEQLIDAEKKYSKISNLRRKEKTKAIGLEDTPLMVDEEEKETGEWYDELIEVILKISPAGFERLCQFLLRKNGFTRVEVSGRTSDGGIDGIGFYQYGLLSAQVLFQSKRYKGSVGSSVVRDFKGAMVGRTDKGMIITTGSFTSEARKEAARSGDFSIELIDGQQLCELLIKHPVDGLRVEMIPSITLDTKAFTQQFE